MIELPDPGATDAFGARLARVLAHLDAGLGIALEGELGAGKTALVRAVLRALGYTGVVVSPSYTLLEPYELARRRLYHLDLYRLGDPEELEFLGIRDIDPCVDWLLVEWPRRGTGFLPSLDLTVMLDYARAGRRASLAAHSQRGDTFLAQLADGN